MIPSRQPAAVTAARYRATSSERKRNTQIRRAKPLTSLDNARSDRLTERRPLQLLDGPVRSTGKDCDVGDRGYRDFPEARLYACRIAPDGEDSVPATFYRVVCPSIAQRLCSIEVEAPARSWASNRRPSAWSLGRYQ